MKKQTLPFGCITVLVAIMLSFGAAEFVLRITGHRPWRPWEINIKVEPGGKWVQRHATLGFIPLEGKHTIIFANIYPITMTILSDGSRITHPLYTDDSGENKKDEIWIFGCSFTQGNVTDNETFPWLLQEKMPDYEVVNFGVGGYSTLQSLILFREAITKRKIPRIVVLNYASYHDPRNTLTREYKKVVFPFNKLGMIGFPCARFDSHGKLIYYMLNSVYNEFPLMRHSAFIAWLEQRYNGFEERFLRGHEVSKVLIHEFYQLCTKYNITFIVTGIVYDADTKDMLDYCTKKGILAVDISVDLSIKGSLTPYDGHPTLPVNRQYASKLYDFIDKGELLGNH